MFDSESDEIYCSPGVLFTKAGLILLFYFRQTSLIVNEALRTAHTTVNTFILTLSKLFYTPLISKFGKKMLLNYRKTFICINLKIQRYYYSLKTFAPHDFPTLSSSNCACNIGRIRRTYNFCVTRVSCFVCHRAMCQMYQIIKCPDC